MTDKPFLTLFDVNGGKILCDAFRRTADGFDIPAPALLVFQSAVAGDQTHTDVSLHPVLGLPAEGVYTLMASAVRGRMTVTARVLLDQYATFVERHRAGGFELYGEPASDQTTQAASTPSSEEGDAADTTTL